MRVMLINPPWYRLQGGNFAEIPLGIAYVAGFLKQKGHTVKVFNADFGREHKFSYKDLYDNFSSYIKVLDDLSLPIWKEVTDKIIGFGPDVVGISMKTGSYKSGCNIARLIKQYNSKIITVAGGPHPTLMPEETANAGYFDYVIKAEGEETFAHLLRVIEDQGQIDSVNGIAFKSNGIVKQTPDREFIKDLDSLPFVERDDLIDRDLYTPDSLSLMMTGRGCPFACTFCESEKIWNRKIRLRSAENVISEIRYVKEKYNSRHFKIRDDLFTMNKKRVLEICERIIKDRLNITWQCEVRGDCLDEDIVRSMRNAGCIGASIGVESGSNDMLLKIKKGETIEQIARGIKLLKKYAINVGAFIMIGFIDETKEQMRRTMEFVRKTQPDHVILSILTPYPGTGVYDEAAAKGLINKDTPWEEYFHQSPRMGLAKNKQEFSVVARGIMADVEAYNNSVARKFKKRIYQVFQNPKAVSKSFLKIISRVRSHGA